MELLVGGTGDGGVECEVDFGDSESAFHFFDGYGSGGFELIGFEFHSAEDTGERHAEASGVGGAEEFFGVGALTFFEAGSEAVWGFVESFSFGGDGAFAFFEVTLPDCATFAYHSFVRLLFGV